MVGKRVVAIVMLVVFVFSQGCSLVGLGIGAAIPRYSDPVDPTTLPRGTSISVEGDDGVVRTGDLVSIKGAEVTIAEGNVKATSKAKEVHYRAGSDWASGLLAGFFVDLGVAVLVAIAVAEGAAAKRMAY